MGYLFARYSAIESEECEISYIDRPKLSAKIVHAYNVVLLLASDDQLLTFHGVAMIEFDLQWLQNCLSDVDDDK